MKVFLQSPMVWAHSEELDIIFIAKHDILLLVLGLSYWD